MRVLWPSHVVLAAALLSYEHWRCPNVATPSMCMGSLGRIMSDHPNVRASGVCPLCKGQKDVGLVACWWCYREEKLKWGNPDAELKIDQAEEVAEGECPQCGGDQYLQPCDKCGAGNEAQT
jgi:hypothetical protein